MPRICEGQCTWRRRETQAIKDNTDEHLKRASGLAGFVPGPTHPHGFPSHQFGKVRDRSDRTAKKENHHVLWYTPNKA